MENQIATTELLFILLPAAAANMAPVFASRFSFLAKPVDGGLTIRGKRLFGDNKTWRGLFWGVLTGVGVALILSLFQPQFFSENTPIIFGASLGLSALAGDLVASAIKRRLNIAPGQRLLIIDQIDWILASLIFLSIFFTIQIKAWGTALLIFGALHLVVSYIGYLLKLKNNPL